MGAGSYLGPAVTLGEWLTYQPPKTGGKPSFSLAVPATAQARAPRPHVHGFRPDSTHTSYVAAIVSLDQRLVRFQLHPGAEDPGPGNWHSQPWLPPGGRRDLVATFNGGFKINVAGGSFSLNGVTKGTLGGAYYVWRSGAGITADGRLVYAYGPALSVGTLAGLLQRAGAVEAMQLDINPFWTSFEYYQAHGHPADPVPANLLPTQLQSADR